MRLLALLVAFALPIMAVDSLRILGIFAHPGKSHFDVFKPLMEALSEKGHEVTVIGYFPRTEKHPRYKDVALKYPETDLHGFFKMQDIRGTRDEKYLVANMIHNHFGKFTCELAFRSTEFQDFLKSNQTFDVIISEFFNTNCLLVPIAGKFKAPFIGISSHVLMPWTNDWVGNPDHPAYTPIIFLDSTDRKSFLQRVESTLAKVYTTLYYRYVIESSEKAMFQKYLGNAVPNPADVMYSTSLILVNSHFSLNLPRPLVPNVVEVGGIHVGKSKKLPENIEKWINHSTHGVIYFSMGTMLKGSSVPEEKKQMFLKVFSRLPQRVLWKWETESWPGKPDNVMTQKWMPQYDILCHPNVKAYIGHGGLLGITEAVRCGVPMVVLPHFGDQFANGKALEANGGGVVLDFWSLTEESIYDALTTVLDPGFNKQAKNLSERFKDRPLPPLETAIYWVEYVAKHGGAPHMRTAAVDMPLYQYLLLDVLTFLLTVLLILGVSVYTATKAIVRKISATVLPKKIKSS